MQLKLRINSTEIIQKEKQYISDKENKPGWVTDAGETSFRRVEETVCEPGDQ